MPAIALIRTAGIALGLLAGTMPAAAKIGSCDDPVTFGTTISSTGQFAAHAEKWQAMTIEFAKMINERGGIDVASCGKKLPLQIVLYDDASDPAKAVAAYEKLAAADQVDFFVGPDWSSIGLPVAAVAAKHRIPTVMANVADPAAVRRGAKYVWATPMPTVANWSARYFDMLSKQTPRPKTIYFVTQDTPVTRSIAEFWKAAATRAGMEIIGDETLPADPEALTPLVVRMRLRRAEIVYIAAFDLPSAPLIRRMRELNLKARDVHHALLSGALRREVGAGVDGMTGEIAWYPGVRGPYADFAGELLRRADIDMFEFPWSMSRLSAYLIMVQAVERAGAVDREKVRAALAKGVFDAPVGRVEFNEAGLAPGNGAFTIQMQDGAPVVVWPPERATGTYLYPSPSWN